MSVHIYEVYDEYKLYENPDKFFIVPVRNKTEVLILDRVTYNLSLERNYSIEIAAHCCTFYGIMGIIHLLSGPYLMLITQRLWLGKINGHDIYEVKQVELYAYSKTNFHLNETQLSLNNEYLSMVKNAVNVPYFYFSYSFDITHSLQRLNKTSPEFLQMSLIERADPRFVWNGFLLKDISSHLELQRYCLPLLHGFISICHSQINEQHFIWSLISRRSCFRAGCRYFVRGIDTEGHAANFIETEQIIEYEGIKTSFVQSRGSVPLYWSQEPNLRIKPAIELSCNLNHLEGFHHHINNQIYNYGSLVIIDLVNQHGIEGKLSRMFSNVIQASKNTVVRYLVQFENFECYLEYRYVAFDFHKECGNFKWENLHALMDELKEIQNEQAYFFMKNDGVVLQQQKGIFRTNCLDCLDRTNVIQSMLARNNMNIVLKKLGLLSESNCIDNYNELYFKYRNSWADNADILSIQYAGTFAQKTDFTRYGKRTFFGMFQDVLNFLIRYYKNNFIDGIRQDSIDLILGNYIVEPLEGLTKPSPLQHKRSLPVIFMLSIAMIFMILLISRDYTTEILLYLLFWLGVLIATIAVISYYAKEFVVHPRLTNIKIKGKIE